MFIADVQTIPIHLLNTLLNFVYLFNLLISSMSSELSQEIIESRKKFAETFGNTKLGGKGIS
jgi:hypothetical protein